jgi:hypothetical protein
MGGRGGAMSPPLPLCRINLQIFSMAGGSRQSRHNAPEFIQGRSIALGKCLFQDQ